MFFFFIFMCAHDRYEEDPNPPNHPSATRKKKTVRRVVVCVVCVFFWGGRVVACRGRDFERNGFAVDRGGGRDVVCLLCGDDDPCVGSVLLRISTKRRIGGW